MRYLPAPDSIRFRRLSDLDSRAIDWLGDGWLPLGELVLLDGDPGVGKSLVSPDLCAQLTAGRPWPDGATAPTPANVVVLSAEDNLERTVQPRLLALGGNLERVYSLDGVVDLKGEEPIRLPAHVPALHEMLRMNGMDDQGRGHEDEPRGDDLSVRMPVPEPRAKE
jgi:hypothetical protein